MEIITFSLLSVVPFILLCVVFYVFHKRYKASVILQTPAAIIPVSTENKLGVKKSKQNLKKDKPKKNPQPRQKKPIATVDNDSDTESYTMEQQLAQTIISQQQFARDSINTTAVNAKPTVKKLTPAQRSNSKTRSGVSNSEIPERDPDWENVVSRKKKKLYPVSKRGEAFEFTLDEEGGVVDIPTCEITFPAESVTKPLQISVDIEKYKKLVDDAEEKVFVTHVVNLSAAKGEDTKLRRHFTMKLNTMRLMGRGWNGNVCCQIETKDADDEWLTTGRTEYIFGKPVQFTGNELSSFRVVITRGQNGAISRDLQIAAYIARPKIPNPTHHFIHLCIYDGSQQSQYKVDSNMQNLLIKMHPKPCNVSFGSDVEFKIQPTQKFTPDDKVVFMRWTEVCKAYVNVRFQIRLNRNESEDPNFESEFRTMVFLEILKIRNSVSMTQGEYFHFYWISATLFPRNQRVKGQNKEKGENRNTASSHGETVKMPLQIVGTVEKPSISSQKSETPKKKKNKKRKEKVDETAPTHPGAQVHPKSTVKNVQSSGTKSASQQSNSKLPRVRHDDPAAPVNRKTKIKGLNQKNETPQSLKVQSSAPFSSAPSHAGKPQVSSKNEKILNLKQFVPIKAQEFSRSENFPRPTINGHQSTPNVNASPRVLRQHGPASKNSNRGNQNAAKGQRVHNARTSTTKHNSQMSNGAVGDQTSLPTTKKYEVHQPQAGGEKKTQLQARNEKDMLVQPKVLHQRSRDLRDGPKTMPRQSSDMHARPKVSNQQPQNAHRQSQGKPDRPAVVHKQSQGTRDQPEAALQRAQDTHQKSHVQGTLDRSQYNGDSRDQKELKPRVPRSMSKDQNQQTMSKQFNHFESHPSSNFTRPKLATGLHVPHLNGHSKDPIHQRYENHTPPDQVTTKLSNGSPSSTTDISVATNQTSKTKRQKIRRRRGLHSSSGSNTTEAS